jgi:hypothetical protein
VSGHPGFLALLDEMRLLHLKKSADYGSKNDPLANVRKAAEAGVEPWRASWLRALDKVHRINAYCQTGRLENESVEDSFLDLASQCLIALALRRETEQT